MIKVLSTAVAVLLVILFAQVYLNKSLNDDLNLANFQIDTLEYRVDSIKSEMFPLETEVNRYRIALEMLENEDFKCASEFNKRLSMTE